MHLSFDELRKCNNIHNFLKIQTYEYLAENEIFVCRKCRGTGLYIINDNINNVDLTNFCETCKGIGYILNSQHHLGSINYICGNCYGRGCEKCDQRGIVDWISNVMGG